MSFRSCEVRLAQPSPAGEDRTAELVVQAGPDDVFLEGDVVRWRACEAGRAIEAAEIDVEIFELGRPVAEEGIFDASAQGPAGPGRAAARRRRIVVVRLYVAEGHAAGDVRQEAINRIAHAAANRGEPALPG